MSVAGAAVVLAADAQSARRPAKPVKRAAPPIWPPAVRDVFFKDAREKLVGQRPDFGHRVAKNTGSSKGDAPPPAGEEAGAKFAWSKLISAATIEDEIKSMKNLVAADVTTATKFKGGDYRRCRTSFSALAVMFGVAAEFDGQVRWRDSAGGLRDLFSRAGANCKVGTDQSYTEAKQRRLDLEELVRGGRFEAPKPREDWKWSDIADRPPLMKRLETAERERLSPWVANEGEFQRKVDGILHEAQIVAALAEIIQREEYEFWDDDSYLEYARSLGKAAREIAAAAEANDYQAARKAAGEMSKSCSACHEDYRS